MSTVVSNKEMRRTRVFLPQLMLYVGALLLICAIAMLVSDQLEKHSQLFRGSYATEAMNREKTRERSNVNVSREATPKLYDVASLDIRGTTGVALFDRYKHFGYSDSEIWFDEYAGDSMKEFHAWDKHLLDQLHQLTSSPTPIWLPRNSREWEVDGTILWGVRQGHEFISQYFEVALFQGDRDTALKALQSHKWLTDCKESDKMNSYYSSYYWLTALHRLICNSMEKDMWSDEDLQTLRNRLLPPINYEPRYRYSVLLQYSEWLEQVSKQPAFTTYDPGTEGMYQQQLANIDKPGVFIPLSVTDLVECELTRRLAIMAIATKQYHRKNNHWPTKLSDLSTFDVPPEFWTEDLKADFNLFMDGYSGVLLTLTIHNLGRGSHTRVEIR